MMRLASWNVNGIRACSQKGFSSWVEENNFDYIALQETKASPEQVEEALSDLLKKYTLISSSAQKKGYSGVSVLIKKKFTPLSIQTNLGEDKFDSEGRTIICEFEDFFIFCNYYPNGQRDHNRVPFKLAYSEKILQTALHLKKKTGKEIILTGDFNTAHQEIDLKNPKSNLKTTGFLPEERQWMDRLFENGFVDIFRKNHPMEEGHYSWWTYRGDCRERNIGWRIDYFILSLNLVSKVKEIKYQSNVLGSDHCPVVLIIK